MKHQTVLLPLVITFFTISCLWAQAGLSVRLEVLGTVQDGGAPHIGCKKSCCIDLSAEEKGQRKVTALGLVLEAEKKHYFFEASPDITSQWTQLHQSAGSESRLDGIFLTHAHIGHYSGLQFLGKEALGGKDIPVYAMPRMKTFLENNGPWSQLVEDRNILIRPLKHNEAVTLSPCVTVTPLRVPHRDEYSETVGYMIQGAEKKALFLPDIDKWERWEQPLEAVLETVDYALLDATFFDAAEINNRDMSAIPHPFVVETLARLAALPKSERQKVIFIHLNHTNPLLNPRSIQSQRVKDAGMHVARIGMQIFL